MHHFHAQGGNSVPTALNLETMKPGLQFASQSSSNPEFGLCGMCICFFSVKSIETPRGTWSSRPGDSASLCSPHGHVEVVLVPGVVQGQNPRKRSHGTHL